MPLFFNLCSIPACHTRSKALEISAKTKHTFLLLSRRKHGINVQVDVLGCALALSQIDCCKLGDYLECS